MPLFRRQPAPFAGSDDDDRLVQRILESPGTVFHRAQAISYPGRVAPVIEMDATADPRAQQAFRAIGGREPVAETVCYVTGMLNPHRAELPAPGGALIAAWPGLPGNHDYDFNGPAIHVVLERRSVGLKVLADAAKLAIPRGDRVLIFFKDRSLSAGAAPEDRIPLGTVPVLVHARPLLALAKAAG